MQSQLQQAEGAAIIILLETRQGKHVSRLAGSRPHFVFRQPVQFFLLRCLISQLAENHRQQCMGFGIIGVGLDRCLERFRRLADSASHTREPRRG